MTNTISVGWELRFTVAVAIGVAIVVAITVCVPISVIEVMHGVEYRIITGSFSRS
jgi:hypothetical protein